MKVRLLRCATMCPAGGLLPSAFLPKTLTCNCLLIETSAGLVLVDTGIGLADTADPSRLGPSSGLLGLRLDPAQTARRQIEALGYSADDVRHLIPTHLDLDHAGGLPDFPRATVHVLGAEKDAALARANARLRSRYRPCHWSHGPDWRAYDPAQGETWKGFARVRALDGLPPEILLVSLPGHTPGHAGVVVESDGGPLLHAGDACFDARETEDAPRIAPGLRLVERFSHLDFPLAMETCGRLRRARREDPALRVICAHDASLTLEP